MCKPFFLMNTKNAKRKKKKQIKKHSTQTVNGNSHEEMNAYINIDLYVRKFKSKWKTLEK